MISVNLSRTTGAQVEYRGALLKRAQSGNVLVRVPVASLGSDHHLYARAGFKTVRGALAYVDSLTGDTTS